MKNRNKNRWAVMGLPNVAMIGTESMGFASLSLHGEDLEWKTHLAAQKKHETKRSSIGVKNPLRLRKAISKSYNK